MKLSFFKQLFDNIVTAISNIFAFDYVHNSPHNVDAGFFCQFSENAWLVCCLTSANGNSTATLDTQIEVGRVAMCLPKNYFVSGFYAGHFCLTVHTDLHGFAP